MNEYNIYKKTLEEKENDEKKLSTPLAILGGTVILSAATYLGADNFVRYSANESYNLVNLTKSVSVIAPIAMSSLLAGYYKLEIQKYLKDLNKIYKQEYYLNNKLFFEDYNKEVNNGNLNGSKVDYEKIDNYSLSELNKVKDSIYKYYVKKK